MIRESLHRKRIERGGWILHKSNVTGHWHVEYYSPDLKTVSTDYVESFRSYLHALTYLRNRINTHNESQAALLAAVTIHDLNR